MIQIIKTLVYFISAVLLAWLLPWTYRFLLSESEGTPFTLYSCMVNDFAYIDVANNGLEYRDFKGNSYTEEQFDSILPFFYYRQLATDGRLPEQIKGVDVTAHSIARENFIFRHSPQNINVRKPKLYPLLESRSGRVDLKMPEDVFRLNNCIEFINMKTNTVDGAKSELFNKAMHDRGFEFPCIEISGNPSAQKEYDEGYLLIDSSRRVFHLKMNAGRPFFRDTGIPAELGMCHAFITEFSNRSILGFFSDSNNNLYVLETPLYKLKQLPINGFNPETESMMIIGDMLHWTVKITAPQRQALYAINASDYSLAGYHEYPQHTDKWATIAGCIFPFEVSFTSRSDEYVQPRIMSVSGAAVFFNLILAAGYAFIHRKRLKSQLLQTTLILPLGVFLFVPLALMERG